MALSRSLGYVRVSLRLPPTVCFILLAHYHEAVMYTTGVSDEARGMTPASSFQGGFGEFRGAFSNDFHVYNRIIEK